MKLVSTTAALAVAVIKPHINRDVRIVLGMFVKIETKTVSKPQGLVWSMYGEANIRGKRQVDVLQDTI